MNLLLLAPEEVTDAGRAVLRDRRAEHLLRVLRVTSGQRLRAGVMRRGLGRAEVIATTRSEVSVHVEIDVPAQRPRVDVVLALPRPKVIPRVLETLAALGVDRIALVNGWRVEKAYFASPRLEPAALEGSLVLGCEQGVQVWVPEFSVEPLFVPFVHERLRHWVEEPDTLALVADPGAARWPEQALVPGFAGRVVIAIGPEGGWIAPEIESLEHAGLTPVSLGPAVLRVEAAAVALLAQVALLRRWGREPARPDARRDESGF